MTHWTKRGGGALMNEQLIRDPVWKHRGTWPEATSFSTVMRRDFLVIMFNFYSFNTIFYKLMQNCLVNSNGIVLSYIYRLCLIGNEWQGELRLGDSNFLSKVIYFNDKWGRQLDSTFSVTVSRSSLITKRRGYNSDSYRIFIQPFPPLFLKGSLSSSRYYFESQTVVFLHSAAEASAGGLDLGHQLSGL